MFHCSLNDLQSHCVPKGSVAAVLHVLYYTFHWPGKALLYSCVVHIHNLRGTVPSVERLLCSYTHTYISGQGEWLALLCCSRLWSGD